ncbi:hypothetical protein KKA33_02875 [Patescibacteria group bacterium]|nr:hypothetical protein [Patescibacteria group bacterium]
MANPLITDELELTSPQKAAALPVPPEAAEKALPSAEHLKLMRGRTKRLLEEGRA